VNSTTPEHHAHRSGTPSISADGICLSFPDSTEVLRNISIEIGDHEFVSVVGPSGCGKSTLLRVLSGLQKPTSGQLNTPSNDVGFVFQDPTLLPWRTALRNVETLLELRGVNATDRRELAFNALSSVGLADSANKYPRQLSGGMKMRVSLARSLVTQPKLFLFDEPFAAVDEFAREQLNDDLLALFASAKFSAVFVTHSISEAVYLSQRVIIMSARPASIAHIIEIPFDYPRSPEIRYQPDFAKCCGTIARHLRQLQNI